MPAAKRSAKTPGLLLDFPGAPEVPHTVAGVPGTFRADRPTPTGGVGEPTKAQAEAAHENPGVPLRLIMIDPEDLDEYRRAAANDRRSEAG